VECGMWPKDGNPAVCEVSNRRPKAGSHTPNVAPSDTPLA